jgi:predicted RecA/RadA family phage recombinase
MKNYVQEGDALTLTAPSGGVTAGNAMAIGDLVGIVANTAAEGETFVLNRGSVFDVPNKAGSLAIAVGDIVYVTSAFAVNKTSSGNKRLGLAVAAAASDATVVRVLVD